MLVRNIMPVACCSGVTASSACTTWMPMVSGVVGSLGCGPVCAAAGAAARTARIGARAVMRLIDVMERAGCAG